VVFAFSVTPHVGPLVLAHPVHDAKPDPLAGVAVSVTIVAAANEAEQTAPQLTPAGKEVTVPAPPPVLFTVRLIPLGSKVA
jgi:hypothetical protein